ncbi:MAG: spondin domain-containing protein [Saprospiraceae bacterium]|nr:spondin domain-containing protein [Saprospiraceae bacterium]
MKKLPIILLASLFTLSCSKDYNELRGTETLRNRVDRVNQQSTNGISQSFLIRIENVISGATFVTPFAPGLWIVQKKKSAPIFIDGEPDFNEGLEDLAEDGNPGILDASLNNHPKVRSKGVFNTPVGSAGPGPIFPGDAYEFVVTAKPKDYLNFATMFIQSNDLFIGPNQQGISLFDSDGEPLQGDITGYLELWDGGTEINEEPGEGPNQAPRQPGPNTGPDENGVVQIVNDAFEYPSVNDMIEVTVTPLP